MRDLEIPGLENLDFQENNQLQISSESDLNLPNAKNAEPANELNKTAVLPKKKSGKRDIKKTFKKMLVQNNQRTNATSCNERSVDNESTKFGGSPRLIEDINDDIEKKYSKKKARRNVFTKYYQEDEMLLENRQP